MKAEPETAGKKRAERLAVEIQFSRLEEGKSVYVSIQGSSMYPVIKNGDRIKITPVDEEDDIGIGDIIAIKRKAEYGAWFIVHRVVKVAAGEKRGIYFTKGDNDKRGPDEAITIESIAGKVNEIERANLKIDLELSLWGYLGKIIAKLSLRHPKFLPGLLRYIDWAVEWRLFPLRVKRRLKMIKAKG